MPPPNKGDGLPWDRLLVFSKGKLDIPPKDFWGLTFGEFWPLYNAAMGNVVKPMTGSDLSRLEEAWANGNIRRTGS